MESGAERAVEDWAVVDWAVARGVAAAEDWGVAAQEEETAEAAMEARAVAKAEEGWAAETDRFSEKTKGDFQSDRTVLMER